MYAPTSTNSPRSGQTSGESGDGLTDFDGAGEILRAWGNGLRPDPRRVTKTGSAQAGDPTSGPAAPASEPEKE